MTDRYDYMKAVTDDVREALSERDWLGAEIREAAKNGESYDKVFSELYEALWDYDSVTGNASGSYTFSTWKAEENLCHNTDLLVEAAWELGMPTCVTTDWKYGPEFWDVTIRCHLLSDALAEVFTEDDYNKLVRELQQN